MGGLARARGHLDTFPKRQRHDGYFESQEGEWDSNGEVLWAFGRYLQISGELRGSAGLAADRHANASRCLGHGSLAGGDSSLDARRRRSGCDGLATLSYAKRAIP